MQTPFTRPDGTPNERRFRQVIDTLQEVVFQTDLDRTWVFLNPAWTELTGFPVEECLGRPAIARAPRVPHQHTGSQTQ